jgi:hypothetical protein
VVYDSDPEAEYQETVNKSRALRRAAEDAGLRGTFGRGGVHRVKRKTDREGQRGQTRAVKISGTGINQDQCKHWFFLNVFEGGGELHDGAGISLERGLFAVHFDFRGLFG